jgi:hypothetical protein
VQNRNVEPTKEQRALSQHICGVILLVHAVLMSRHAPYAATDFSGEDWRDQITR